MVFQLGFVHFSIFDALVSSFVASWCAFAPHPNCPM